MPIRPCPYARSLSSHVGQETAAVTGDLKSGEHIVALGAHLLKPAEKIRVAAANQQENAQ